MRVAKTCSRKRVSTAARGFTPVLGLLLTSKSVIATARTNCQGDTHGGQHTGHADATTDESEMRSLTNPTIVVHEEAHSVLASRNDDREVRRKLMQSASPTSNPPPSPPDTRGPSDRQLAILGIVGTLLDIVFVIVGIVVSILNILVTIGATGLSFPEILAKSPMGKLLAPLVVKLLTPYFAAYAAFKAALAVSPKGLLGLHKPKAILFAMIAAVKAFKMAKLVAAKAAFAAMVVKALAVKGLIAGKVVAKKAVLSEAKLTLKEKSEAFKAMLAAKMGAGIFALGAVKAKIIEKKKGQFEAFKLFKKKKFNPLGALASMKFGETGMTGSQMAIAYSTMVAEMEVLTQEVGSVAGADPLTRQNMYEQAGMELDAVSSQVEQVEAFAGPEENDEIDSLRETMLTRIQELQTQLVTIAETQVGTIDTLAEDGAQITLLVEQVQLISEQITGALAFVPEREGALAAFFSQFNAAPSPVEDTMAGSPPPDSFLAGLFDLLQPATDDDDAAAVPLAAAVTEPLVLPNPDNVQVTGTDSGSAEGSAQMAQVDAQVEAVFDIFDTDGSGSISESELRTAMSMADPSLTEMEITDAITHADANSDGSVDKSELATLIASM